MITGRFAVRKRVEIYPCKEDFKLNDREVPLKDSSGVHASYVSAPRHLICAGFQKMCTGSNQRNLRVDNGESRESTHSDLGLNGCETDVLPTNGPGHLIGTNSTCTKRYPEESRSFTRHNSTEK